MAILFLSSGSFNDSHAQNKKSRYEKIQEKKNKANRRLRRRGDKSRKAPKKFWIFNKRSRQGDRPYKGDIAGRKVRSRISPTKRSRAAYPQPNPYAGRKRSSEAARAKAFKKTVRYSKRPREKAWKGNISGNRLRSKGFRSEKARLKPQYSPYFKKRKGTGERDGSRFSGQGFKGLRTISGRSRNALKKKRITPRSVSGAYTVRKRKKPYAWRERSKWEDAYQGDITGRKFRAKKPSLNTFIQKPPKVKYSQGKGRRGDRAYKGQITGGYKSVTSGKEKAWKGDISGTKLRKRTSERPKFNDPHFKIYPKGKRRGDKAYKGKLPGGGYKTVGKRTERTGKALPRKPPSGRIADAVRFQGNIKTTRPKKGGGSISGDRWNNSGKPIQGRGFRKQDQQVARFQGNIKAGKPLKGGGSISGDRWNNDGKPIQGRSLRKQDQQVAKYQGNLRQWKYKTGPLDEMKWEGRFKRKKGERNPNAAKEALKSKGVGANDRAMAGFSGNIKQWKYKTGPLDEMKWEGRFKRPSYSKNSKSARESIDVRKFENKTAGFQGRFKSTINYKRNPKSSKEALLGRAPSSEARKGSKFQGRFKLARNYKTRPNAAKGSLKGIGPSKAAISASNFQGNIKMRKDRMANRHPSFKFDKPRDTPIEKTKFSFKVLWSKLFKKNENQPAHLKEKPRKPRYDKDEEGLWNE